MSVYHIALRAVTAEESLLRLIVGMADYKCVSLVSAVRQHQFDVAVNVGLAVEAVAEGVGHIIDAHTGFQLLEVYLVDLMKSDLRNLRFFPFKVRANSSVSSGVTRAIESIS